MKLQLNQIIKDSDICGMLKIELPSKLLGTREEVTQEIVNFQIKKAHAVASYNKDIRHTGLQLSQQGHTLYRVVSTKTKKEKLERLTNTMTRALSRF